MSALNLYKRNTQAELVAMQEAIRSDPANKLPPGSSLYIYTPKARKRLNDIAWAIRYHTEDKRTLRASSV